MEKSNFYAQYMFKGNKQLKQIFLTSVTFNGIRTFRYLFPTLKSTNSLELYFIEVGLQFTQQLRWTIRHRLMLLWLKMNIALRVTLQDSTFRHSCLVSSSGCNLKLLNDSFYTFTNRRLFLLMKSKRVSGKSQVIW